MRPFESGAKFDVSQLTKEDLVSSVKQAFYSEQLELPQNDRMTATEVQVRYERMQQLLGPALFRIQADFLNPLVNRCFNILFREQALPDVPQVVADSKGTFEVDYLGPLARSQKMGTVNALQQLVGVIERVAQFDPSVLKIIKWSDALRDAGLAMSVPAKHMKTEDEVKKEQEAEAQAQKQQMEAEQGQMNAGAAKDHAQAEATQAEAQGQMQ